MVSVELSGQYYCNVNMAMLCSQVILLHESVCAYKYIRTPAHEGSLATAQLS